MTRREPGKSTGRVPLPAWLVQYKRSDLTGDVTAGAICAVMLAPQSMAYAMLAGLPAQAGLYASIVPVLLYAAFGSSKALAVGPVALLSLLTASAVGTVTQNGTVSWAQAATVLALMVGLINLLLGVLKAGFLVNFLSHPVISGFTSASALLIGGGQLKHLLGISLPEVHTLLDIFSRELQEPSTYNPTTMIIAASGMIFVILTQRPMVALLQRFKISRQFSSQMSRVAPLFLVAISTMIVASLSLAETRQVAIVGEIPTGLPPLTMPVFDIEVWRSLFPAALLISIIGFVESVSVAKALAAKKRQKINADAEFAGLGMANIGASLTGGFPVTGGFSRSIVNFQAGANSPLASIFTVGWIILTVLFLTPLFYYLPKAILAVIIMAAVLNLVDWKTPRALWRYDRSEALTLFERWLRKFEQLG